MKRKFLLEIDDSGAGLKAFSSEEMEMFFRHGVDNFLGKKRMEAMNIRVFPYVDKSTQIIDNEPPTLQKIALHHTESEGFRVGEEKDEIADWSSDLWEQRLSR